MFDCNTLYNADLKLFYYRCDSLYLCSGSVWKCDDWIVGINLDDGDRTVGVLDGLENCVRVLEKVGKKKYFTTLLHDKVK